MGFSPPSTVPLGLSAALARCHRGCSRWDSRSALAFTLESARSSATIWPHVALATTICVKMVEQTLFKHILRKVAPIKPSTQLCHEFAFVVHRLRRISLAAETCRKCIDVGRQRANAGQLDRR